MNLEEKIEDLLKINSSGGTPNYYEFYPAIKALLEKGFPPKSYCDVFISRLSEYNSILENISSESTPTKADFEVYNKMKLLLGYIDKLPTDLKEYIFNKNK